MDLREYALDWEEMIRTAFAGLAAGQWHAMPGILTEASPDGHNATVQIAIRRVVTDPVTGARSYEDHPPHPDVVVHFPGGAGVTFTHGLAQGDEGLLVYGNRNLDSWRQSGGTQIPVDNRMSGYADPHLIPGIRSDPRKLQQVDTKAAHLRSDDKLHVHELHPDRGHRTFSADPSTPPASPSFDPLSQAEKFVDHAVTGAGGVLGRAVNGGTEHSHGVTHDDGAFMRALGTLHQVLCHPSLGALLSAAGGAHTVKATPSGVDIASSLGINLQCPPGMLSLPKGGVSGASIQTGGDLSGTLDEAQVTSLLNVSNANALPNAANDAAAAALSPPVGVGHLYRNGSVLMVRVA